MIVSTPKMMVRIAIMFKSGLVWTFYFVLVGLTNPARACIDLAAQRYNVSPILLQAIAQHESGGRAHAMNHNPNGTRDIGLMQINSSWLPLLARYGIAERDLYDPCVSTLVGAWILSNNFARLGYTTQGLGAYNAASPDKRERYAAQVLHRMTLLASHP